jgi:serine phosphatase RsbU (regulator of sigma subunit)
MRAGESGHRGHRLGQGRRHFRDPGNRNGAGNGDAEGSGRLLRALPILLITGGFLLEALSSAGFTGAPLYSAAPLVTAAIFSLRATAAVGAAALVSQTALHAYQGTMLDTESATELVTVLTVTVLALFINHVVQSSGRRLASARGVAEAAQLAVLPRPPEWIGGLQVAARYEAAHTEASIGGDLYAVQDTPYGVRLIVGDVRGKGLGAVETVAIVLGAFREVAGREATLEDVAGRLDRSLRREDERREGLYLAEGFTTAVLAEAAADRGFLRLLNRGHPPPLLLHADGAVREARPALPAAPLGMTELGSWPYRADELAFPEGATLLLFTDGVTEARDTEGVFFDLQERLRGRRFPGPDVLLDALVEDVERHTAGDAADDMALLAVRRPGRSSDVESGPAVH